MPKKTRPSTLESRPSSIEKAIDILFYFDPQHPQLRLTDISERLGLHKTPRTGSYPCSKRSGSSMLIRPVSFTALAQAWLS